MQLTTFINSSSPTIRFFDIFTDSVALQYSSQYGDGSGYDLCSPQEYDIREIINNVIVPSDLVALDPVNRVLSLQTSDPSDSGLHDMLLCVTLTSFNVEYCQQFSALVSDCEVTALTMSAKDPPGTQITYSIQEPSVPFTIPRPNIAYTPQECVYDLIFTLETFGGSDPTPGYI